MLSFTISNITHSDGLYQAAFVHTFVFVGVATFLCLVIGYPFAYFLARKAGRWRGLFLALFFAPFWISYMLRMLAWISLLQDDGYVNRILEKLGLIQQPYPWLSGKPVTVIIGLVYGYVPFMVLPLYATLDRIHPSMLEAGRDLGASPARTFWRVTLPLSTQGILAGLVICALPMFGDYFTQQLLANTANTRMIGNAIVDALDPAHLRRPRRRPDPGAAGAADRPHPLLPAQHEPGCRAGGAMSAPAAPATAERPAGSRLLRAISNPWGETRFLWVLAIGYVAWSLVPVVIAVVFSFNSARSLTQWGGFSLRWYIRRPEQLGVARPEPSARDRPEPEAGHADRGASRSRSASRSRWRFAAGAGAGRGRRTS